MAQEITIERGNIQLLMSDLRSIIESAKNKVATTANYELTIMYWHIGERINRDILGNERAEYGKRIISDISKQMKLWYGNKGFEERNIRRMMQFAKLFPNFEIVSAVPTQLSWSHIIEILPLQNELQREFYLTMALSNHWGIRQLRKEIDSMLYERTAISSKPDELIRTKLTRLREKNELSPELVFKNPYFNSTRLELRLLSI